jgi:methionyl-tRNA formyltransferase
MNSSKKNTFKLLIVSANQFGWELAKEIRKNPVFEIVGLITLAKTSQIKMYDGVASQQWLDLKIPIYRTSNLNSEIKLIQKLQPTVVLVCGWRQIINQTILNYPALGWIGFHPTLLPKGRGPAPIINTLLSGTKKSGITLFLLDQKVDHGPIIAQRRFSILPTDTATQLYQKTIDYAKKIVNTDLPKYLKGEIKPRKQNEQQATYFPKRTIQDNEINPTDSLEIMYRKIKAYNKPYLGAYLKKRNQKLVIWQAAIE